MAHLCFFYLSDLSVIDYQKRNRMKTWPDSSVVQWILRCGPVDADEYEHD